MKVKDEKEIDAIINEHVKHMNGKSVLGMLTKIGDSTISPCTREDQGWKKLSMAVDSGACENVIDAEEEVSNYPIVESRASKLGVKYASATGEEIANLGQVVLPMLTSEGTKRRMTMQAAEVSNRWQASSASARRGTPWYSMRPEVLCLIRLLAR